MMLFSCAFTHKFMLGVTRPSTAQPPTLQQAHGGMTLGMHCSDLPSKGGVVQAAVGRAAHTWPLSFSCSRMERYWTLVTPASTVFWCISERSPIVQLAAAMITSEHCVLHAISGNATHHRTWSCWAALAARHPASTQPSQPLRSVAQQTAQVQP